VTEVPSEGTFDTFSTCRLTACRNALVVLDGRLPASNHDFMECRQECLRVDDRGNLGGGVALSRANGQGSVDEGTKMGTADLIWIGHDDECAVLVTDGTRNAREVLKTFEDHVARSRHESALVLLSPGEARALAGKLLGSARLVEAAKHAG